MEHLTKQQIVLLTLFTSFVTSIATGIVTVALMDQTPVSVSSGIDHVIEHTIEEVVPSDSSGTQSAAVSNAGAQVFSNPTDQIAYATALAQKSLVRIEMGNMVTGLGVIVSSSGIIMSDKSTVSTPGYYVAITSDGTQYPLQTIQTQNNGDLVFLLAQAAASTTASSSGVFTPVSFASLSGSSAPQLGETVISLSGDNSTSVNEGIIKKINMTTDIYGNVTASSTISSLETNLTSDETSIGGPLFDTNGKILGLKTVGTQEGAFYPVGYLQSIIPSL